MKDMLAESMANSRSSILQPDRTERLSQHMTVVRDVADRDWRTLQRLKMVHVTQYGTLHESDITYNAAEHI